ncbi:hypothetical protein DFJ67_7200 [Asanoa ferruginea]|uniref:Cell wall-associated NlpC family hydrolase n=1 Tax=Asanoa ferruginea TaxID=53367 RepID=A0A3D9ZX37_9ACTN|nr:WD40 repeat domain-containing protein [Asanoa ferruginea]REG01123.1 hypothetical protein DFJ67_7200 [Asanoa ferruginea]GIF47175.1 hypothetical protein Afe04nite_17140 [Asanoa ferruginea]
MPVPKPFRSRISLGAVLLAVVALAGAFAAGPAHAQPSGSDGSYYADSSAVAQDLRCGANGSSKWTSRADVVARARSWIGKTPYSQNGCHSNAYGSYRRDCSGMVSMAWGLGGDGADWWTGNLGSASYTIAAADLRAGDALLYHDGTSDGSHVAIFVRWADTAHSKVVVIQETGSADNTIEGVPTNFNWRNYTPKRYKYIVDRAPVAGSANNSKDGNLQEFVVGADRTLRHWAYDFANSRWALNENLGGSVSGAVATVTSSDGNLQAFARGTDGTLRYWVFDFNGGGWISNQSLGGSIIGSPTATNSSDGNLQVFAWGSDNTLRHWSYDFRLGRWLSNENLGGNLGSNPVATNSSDGNLQVFARDGDATLRHWAFNFRGGGWQLNENLGGSLSSSPTVTTSSDGNLQVFARGSDQTLRHWAYNFGLGRWSGNESLGGLITATPAATSSNDGNLQVFARGNDGTLKRWAFDFPRGSWTVTNEAMGGNVIGDVIATTTSSDGNLQVFAEGADQTLRYWAFNFGSGQWVYNQNLGGNLPG